MTEIQVRPKSNKYIAWQYTEVGEIPVWVKNHTKLLYGDLLLSRQSGMQLLDLYDWLIKDLDGGIIWCPDKDMWKEWEKV